MKSIYFHVGIFVFLMSTSAQAQLINQYINVNPPSLDTSSGVTVASRLHPDYDPSRVTIGNTTISPAFSEQFGYDSNVTGVRNGPGSSLIETSAGLSSLTNWSRGSLGINLSIDNQTYLDQPKQSQTAWSASIGSSRSVGEGTISLQYSHQNNVQNGRSLNAPLLDHPIDYRIDDVRSSYSLPVGRFTVQPALEFSYLSFDNGTEQGIPVLQSFRDRVVVSPSLAVHHEFSPLREAVFVLRDSSAFYTRSSQPNLDFNDVSFLTGLNFNSEGPWQFQLLGGYELRTFTSKAFKTISTPIAEAGVTWTPTLLTTVQFSISHSVEDSASEFYTSSTSTYLRLSIDHELRRNVVVSTFGAYGNYGYSSNGGAQSQYNAGSSVTWLLNRSMRLGASYSLNIRQGSENTTISSTTPGTTLTNANSYIEHTLLLQFRVNL